MKESILPLTESAVRASNTVDALEVLTAARARIADPANWTQHHFALNADGVDCQPDDSDACRWCAIGAIAAAGESVGYIARASANGALHAVARTDRGRDVFSVNDDGTHADVLALFDAAIVDMRGAH